MMLQILDRMQQLQEENYRLRHPEMQQQQPLPPPPPAPAPPQVNAMRRYHRLMGKRGAPVHVLPPAEPLTYAESTHLHMDEQFEALISDPFNWTRLRTRVIALTTCTFYHLHITPPDLPNIRK